MAKTMERASNRINEDLEQARTRKTTAEADIKEMEVAQAAGQLIPIDEVVKTWTDLLANVKAKCLAIPVKVAPLVQHEDNVRAIEFIIDDQIREALHELANYNPGQNGKGKRSRKASDENSEAATKTNGKRVGRPRKATKLRSQRRTG